MQTSEGLWGIRIDREGTVITAERPSRHEPKDDDSGIVTVGLIRQGELDHSLLDAPSTWRALRKMVLSWYDRLGEATSSAGFLDLTSTSAPAPIQG
jgi:hypothetical protein